MLASEMNRMRWMGIDMRSRRRRRIVVVMTYVAFLMATGWITSGNGYGWLTPVIELFGLFFAMEFLTIFREGGPVKALGWMSGRGRRATRRRCARCCIWRR